MTLSPLFLIQNLASLNSQNFSMFTVTFNTLKPQHNVLHSSGFCGKLAYSGHINILVLFVSCPLVEWILLSFSSCCYDKSNFKEWKALFQPLFQFKVGSIVEGMPRQQQPDSDDHTAPTMGKQRATKASAQLTLSQTVHNPHLGKGSCLGLWLT